MSNRFHRWILVICLSFPAISPLSGQSSASDTVLPAVHLATITTDTGDFAPGHRDYARYTDPRMCIAAAAHTRDQLRRTVEAQTRLAAMWDTPEKDRLPAEAAVIAKTCSARFPATDARVSGFLPELFTLALMGEDDSLAHAILTHSIAHAPTSVAKIHILRQAIDTYLAAEPVRMTAAEAMVAQLEVLEPDSLGEHLRAHTTLLQFGLEHADRQLIQRETERNIAVLDAMNLPQLRATGGVVALWRMFRGLMTLAWLDSPDSIPRIAQRFQQEYRRPPVRAYLADACRWRSWKDGAECRPIASAPLDTVIRLLTPVELVQLPQTAPPVRADFWFPAAGQDTLHPRSGTASLIRGVNFAVCIRQGDRCRLDISRFRAIVNRFATAGLSTTIVVNAPGYTILEEPASPAVVARSYRWYVQDYLKLPVSVAVRTDTIKLRLPSPDGRVFYGGTRDTDLYSHNDLVLADRKGQVLYRGGGGSLLKFVISDGYKTEFPLEWLIARAVMQPSPGTATPLSAKPAVPSISPAAGYVR